IKETTIKLNRLSLFFKNPNPPTSLFIFVCSLFLPQAGRRNVKSQSSPAVVPSSPSVVPSPSGCRLRSPSGCRLRSPSGCRPFSVRLSPEVDVAAKGESM
ncbi:unnamed protein product, partial [Linum tenue]